MRARAKAAEATREKILDAAEAAFDEGPLDSFTLAAIAERSGVTAQTILRRFGSRDGLLLAMLVHTGVKMGRNREGAPAGNIPAAIGILVDHYDKFGERILRLLGAEDQSPELRTMTDIGRAYHREWCEEIFAAGLEGLRGAKRERRVAQFVAVTDIYFWKLLRLDRELSPRQTKLAMRELIEPLMEPPS
jgi:AcrR family transcriptional regulator